MRRTMARPVRCSIVDMPDGRFAVVAVLASGKVFGRMDLLTLAEAEESVDLLRAAMMVCGAPVITDLAPPEGVDPRRRVRPGRRE